MNPVGSETARTRIFSPPVTTWRLTGSNWFDWSPVYYLITSTVSSEGEASRDFSQSTQRCLFTELRTEKGARAPAGKQQNQEGEGGCRWGSASGKHETRGSGRFGTGPVLTGPWSERRRRRMMMMRRRKKSCFGPRASAAATETRELTSWLMTSLDNMAAAGHASVLKIKSKDQKNARYLLK